MDNLAALPIHDLVPKFKLNAFVETGTWRGAGLAFARGFQDLEEFHSVEYNRVYYEECKKMFWFDDRVHLYLGNSGELMSDILSFLEERRVLFWLDAHLPELYGEEPDSEATRLPLMDELKTIFDMRPRNDDFIIVDDLRIYEEGPYEHGNLAVRPTPNADFLLDFIGDRYDVSKAVWQTGFLILSPKS